MTMPPFIPTSVLVGRAGRDGSNVLPTDDAIADAIGNPNSATAAELSAATARATKDLRGDVMLGLVAACESGTQSCGVNVMSDSTGVPTTSWPWLFADHIADTYPDLTVQTRQWNDSTQDYDRPVAIQTGPAGVRYAQMASASPTALTQRFTGPTGDYDIRIKLALPDWTPASTIFLLQHWNADTLDNDFILRLDTDGKPQLTWYPDGDISHGKTAASDTAVPYADGAAGWIRVTHDIDNGASGNTVKWYTSSDDGTTWTQLGSTITNAGGSGVTTHYASTREYQLGPAVALAKYYEIEIRNGINGPTVAPRMAEHWNRTIGTGPATLHGAPVVTFAMGCQNGKGIGYDDNAATFTDYFNDPVRMPKMVPDFGTLAQFFSTGINELERGGLSWIKGLTAWVDSVRAILPGADPIVLTSVPVVNPTYSSGPRKRRPWTLAYGQRAAGQVHVIDTAQAFLDDGRSLDVLLGGDDTHPTTEGYIVMASPVIANFEAARQRIAFQEANASD